MLHSTRNGFEMVVAMVGGEVNSDRGLGEIFVTENAKGVCVGCSRSWG